ncbi:SH3 domain-containing protein [Desulfoplanes sp.]
MRHKLRCIPTPPALAALCLLVLFCSACSPPPSPGMIRDLQTIPQHVAEITSNMGISAPDHPPIVDSGQPSHNYLDHLFAPWHLHAATLYPADKLLWSTTGFAGKNLVGENLQPWPAGRLEELVTKCGLNGFPNMDQRAVTVRDSNVRALPTNHPGFYPFDRPGEGYPFDYMQYSIMWAGTPVHICHISKDKAWALVEAGFVYGWVPINDLARVDETFMARFESDHFAVPLRDDLSLVDTEGVFRFQTHIGGIYPVETGNPDDPHLLLPVADQSRRAVLVTVDMQGLDMAPFPLPMTPANRTFVAEGFMGQAYGWGNMYANRDCSAMTRDFMTPFGIWLTRNSSRQAEQGKRFNLAGLSPGNKEQAILDQGIPMRTIVWMPGHVALYLGTYQGKPVIMHNTWGLKTKSLTGKEGRHVIGKTVITSLYPGAELSELDTPSGLLINKITGMSIFP